MTNVHQISSCCHAAVRRFGDRRRQCVACKRTWRINTHKRGRKRQRTHDEIVHRVVYEGESLKCQHKHLPYCATRTIAHRFEKQLTHVVARPPSYPPNRGSYVLIVDALWYTFGGAQWTLYLCALKPRQTSVVHVLDPVLLPGKESARDWDQVIEGIPPKLVARIRGFVSDNFAGATTIADKREWVHQLCQFHLLKEVHRRLGRRRLNHTAHRDIRERIYKHLNTCMAADAKKTAHARGALMVLARNKHCPHKLRMIVYSTRRALERYRAFRTHPELGLPSTTGVMESLAAQIRLRTTRLRSPTAVQRWATAYVRMQKTMRCNGKNQPN